MTLRPHRHLADSELLLAIDGEQSARDTARVEAHLSECWSCRVRKQEIEASIAAFVRFHEGDGAPALPPAAGPRALLKARMAADAETSNRRFGIAWPPADANVARSATVLAACCVCLFFGILMMVEQGPRAKTPPVLVPNSRLTPGATVLAGRQEVCSASEPKDRMVPVSLRRRVFEEYGVRSAEARAYEVDYLITPALGGADDIRNLWPQSYTAGGWNARVKDALEDRLHDMVCEGQLDLATAQREISTDWIGAYKKYFHTDRPLETARP